jgi:hypothetical protein
MLCRFVAVSQWTLLTENKREYLNTEFRTAEGGHVTSKFDIPCSTFCGSLFSTLQNIFLFFQRKYSDKELMPAYRSAPVL